MNAFKVAKLARENNEVLRILDNRWALPKSENNHHPVPDLVHAVKATWLLASAILFLLFACVQIVHLFTTQVDYLRGWFAAVISLLGGVFCNGVAYMHWKRILDPKSADNFTGAVSRLESIYRQLCPTNRNMWVKANFDLLSSDQVKAYLHVRATKLKKFERYSWRKQEGKSLREELYWEIEILSRLMLMSPRREDYFVDPPTVSVSAGR